MSLKIFLLCGPHIHARGPQKFLLQAAFQSKNLRARGPQIFPLQTAISPQAAVYRPLVYSIEEKIAGFSFFSQACFFF